MNGSPTDVQELARVQRLATLLRERDLDLLLVDASINLRYLTAFTGSNGLALIVAREGQRPQLARHRFFTDFRYQEQSAAQIPAAFDREIVSVDLLEAAAGLLERVGPDQSGNGGRLGFDDAALTVKQHARLRELVPDDWELVASAGLVEQLREVKDTIEIARIRAASELADEALRRILERGLVGRTERDVAIELELSMRRLGAERPSFPSIVAAAEHSALPHAEPRDVEIPPATLVTIDWGAQLEGYCSDGTRTFATGQVSELQREVYELVLRAHEASLAQVRAGISGRELDAIARDIIERAGHGEHFGHGLGHGVGMDIHEAPRLSRLAGDTPLQAGNIVTVEPGVYLPGHFGVRIEDLAVVTESGADSLSAIPKQLTVVD